MQRPNPREPADASEKKVSKNLPGPDEEEKEEEEEEEGRGKKKKKSKKNNCASGI